MKRNHIRLFIVLLASHLLPLTSSTAQTASVAGLFPIANSGRVIYNFNEGWRFWLGEAEQAAAIDFDDSQWEVACVPHTVRLEPSEVSGCRN